MDIRPNTIFSFSSIERMKTETVITGKSVIEGTSDIFIPSCFPYFRVSFIRRARRGDGRRARVVPIDIPDKRYTMTVLIIPFNLLFR